MRADELLDLAGARGAGGDGASLLPSVSSASRYFDAARASGCPADQVRNFLRAGVVLQPRQLVASAIARLCDADGGPIELAYGGARGGGKSFWLLAQLADDCQRYPGLKCLMLRKVGGSGKEGFEDLLPRVLGGLKYQYIPTSNLLVFPNGSRIKLGHFKDEKDVDKYLGLEYDVIGVEEATTLTASKYRAIRTCNRTSKAGWRPRIYSTTNPGGIGHDWYKRRFIDPYLADAETTTRFVPATIDDNAFVNAEYKGILDTLTGWQLRAWRHGDWDIASGQYFSTFSREHHACGVFGRMPRTGATGSPSTTASSTTPRSTCSARRATATSTASTSTPRCGGVPTSTPAPWTRWSSGTGSRRSTSRRSSPAATAGRPNPMGRTSSTPTRSTAGTSSGRT